MFEKRICKGVFDFCFALVALLVLLPMLLAIAVAVKVTSRGPVFYRSERLSRDGRPFRMLKFRSMYLDPDTHLDALIVGNGSHRVHPELGLDPRITPVGKVIRELRLDELPQFLNVLCGQMSIVGPRPQVHRVLGLSDRIPRAGVLRPGLTGLGSDDPGLCPTPEDVARLDAYYLENWSLLGDLRWIAKALTPATAGPVRPPRSPSRIRRDRPRRAA